MLLKTIWKRMDILLLCKEDGESALKATRKNPFDLLILDVMLPKKDGFTLAQELRNEKNKAPIIFLTARGMKKDKIKGFEIGADDYITKPFDLEVLLLRIKAVIRRAESTSLNNTHSAPSYLLQMN